ncbi:chromate efflux transporter [Geomonas oryzae]|jgi:chromate transporter, chromate ion transporter (CHR) family|uniref:chromate efflux transporter n=1 Tax=Geomonas oryzae TaxID=2364273 RepID=UPI00100C2D9A|nr:chromate efflux transporter [Geomonas oryzae]
MTDARDENALIPVGLWELVLYFLRLGALGFGGPIALAGYMQRDLVARRWVSEQEYKEGLAFSQTCPGPLAAQLAMWMGFIRHGATGASLVGIAFILPPYLMVLIVAFLYVTYHGLPVVQALFYGIGPAVIAVVALSAQRLARTLVGKDKRLWVIFATLAVITVVAKAEIAWLFVVSGGIGVLLYHPPQKWRRYRQPESTLLALPAAAGKALSLSLLGSLGAFFVKAGAFTFGSGLAIVPFLHQGVVLQHHWLNERQFLDAVAVGIITPGPVVITAAFVGYLVAGVTGSVIAAAAVFLPVYLFVLFIGRYILRYREHPALQGFVKGATAAATGAIAGASVILAEKSVIDLNTALIGGTALLVLWRFKTPELLVVALSAVAGVVLYPG